MRRAEIITAFILGLFSVYLMWKSGEPPAWNPEAARFDNIDYDDTGALIGFLLVIEFLGFYAAMLAFLVYYIRFIGRHGWAVTLCIGTALPVVCVFFFDIAMRIVLPKGYSEPLFIPLYDIFL